MAGNTRFHSKFHYAQHHSEVTSKNTTYPDATTDPIASAELPFQGDFHSDGVLKITALDATRFNYFGNDVHIDSNLRVTNNTVISGDLEVVGNVVLKANPAYTQAQRIQIGDDKGGIDQIVDLVTFISYVDSDFTPLSSQQHNLGEHERRWWNLYVTNINLDGVFKIGTCKKDGQSADKGVYIDAGTPGPYGRLGINTCEPNRELDVTGDMEIHGDIKLDDHKSVYWDSLSANNTKTAGISGSPERLTMEHPLVIELFAKTLNLDRHDVNVKLNETQDALTIGDCLTHYDELNNRVGIHTCNPTVELDIVGSYQLSGDTSKTYVTQEVLIESDDKIETKSTGITKMTSTDDMLLESTSNDISLRASKTVQTLGKDVSMAAQSSIQATAGASTMVNSPTIITSGKRLLFTADTFGKITTPTFDIDAPEIDLSTQETSIKLIDSTHALNVHECLLKLNTTDKHVGINVCNPTVELDVAGDVLLTAPTSIKAKSSDVVEIESGGNAHVTVGGQMNLSAANTINVDSGDVTTINSEAYTNITTGKVGFNVVDPVYRISIPCGDMIGTFTDGSPISSSHIQFCGDTENDAGDRNMVITNNNDSDIVIDPGRSVVMPGETNLGIGMIPRDLYALDIIGDTHIQGSLTTTGSVTDKTLIADRVIYKDDVTEQNSTTDEFYYDGSRAAIGHLPVAGETAMLYVAKGPVKLASSVGKVMTINSTSDVVVDNLGVRDMTLIRTPENHSYVVDIPHTDDLSTFSVAFREQTAAVGVYDPAVLETKFYIRPNNTTGRAFFGFNTTEQTVTNDSSGFVNYDAIINQNVNVDNNIRVGNSLHVEDNATVDGMLTVNSESEATGIELRSGSGARLDLIDTIAGIDHRYEFESHKSIAGEVPGTGSTHGSTISNANNDHMVLDLRNTSQDHRFALRYSSNNDGVADKIVMTAGHYIYDIDNPNYDPTQPASSSNPQQIAESRQGHVGINCIPTQDYHLDVNGNMRITGNFVVDGASTQIQAANLEVEDKNITLNITPGGTSTNASTFNAGILIQGNNNTITGYVKVHPNNVDQLVAKAPDGQEINFDINGNTTSILRMEETTIDHKQSTHTVDNSTITFTGTNSDITNSTISVQNINFSALNSTVSHGDSSTLSLGDNSTFDIGTGAQLFAEPGKVSRVDQDLTIDSKTVQFDGLYVSGAMTIPSANGAVANWSGSVRFNPTTKMFEGNMGTNWVPFNGWLSDNDGDTYIKTKDSGLADNDEIEFYIDGELVLFMNKEKAEFTTKYGFTIPAGDTLNRPSDNIVQPGSFRFNTEYKYYEGYDGDNWMQVGGVIDLDRDTYWTAHADISSNLYATGVIATSSPAGVGSININPATRLDVGGVGPAELIGLSIIINNQTYTITDPGSNPGTSAMPNALMNVNITPVLVDPIAEGAEFNIISPSTGPNANYPGDPDILRAFTAGSKTFEIGNNSVKFFNSGEFNLGIAGMSFGTRIDSTGMIDLNPGGDVNIHQHGSGTGLRLANKLVTSSADELNRSDITAVGQSENNKVVTQSGSGVVTIGQTQGNQSLNIASHDEVDAGLKLAGTLVTASAAEINVLDGITSSTKELNYLDIPSLTKADLQKLADVNATAAEINDLFTNAVDASDFTKLSEVTSTSTQLNFLTATGLTKADLQKLADINASAAEINDLYNNAVDSSDFTKLSQVTSDATELNYLDGVIPGTAGSTKALVTDDSRNIGNIKDLATTNLVMSPTVQGTTVVHAGSGGVQSTGPIVGTSGTLSSNLNVSGSAFVAGEVHSSSTSDARLKLNLKKIDNPLGKLKHISGYNFDWDKEAAVVSELAGSDTGVVAQEVEKAVPEAVVDKANGYKGVKYEKLIPLLIECVKDQQQQIDQLKAQLGQ